MFIRPVNSLNFNTNYFLPGKLFGDHAFKVGGYWRDSHATVDQPHRRQRDGCAIPTAGVVPTRNDCTLAADRLRGCS